MFRIPREIELTPELLQEYISKHKNLCLTRYDKLYRAYVTDHDIFHAPRKPEYKPDNRIAVNFPKYIVDTMQGFFIGNPIKLISKDENVADVVEFLDQYNDQDNNNAELSKICSIYGHGFEMYYADEKGNLCITYLDPREAFIIYDDSIVARPLYFIRRYVDYENNEWGSISNGDAVRHFKITGGFRWTDNDWIPHYFDGVPATEYLENAERQGIFEPVMSLVNGFNKVLSEKMNDSDYFSDAYLKIFGPELTAEDLKYIRDNRILNFNSGDIDKILAEFMEKPSNDTGQENLLNRLERLIFQISMVANISDENFGTSSGIALQYKLLAMSNQAKTKARKFTSGMNRRYKILFSHPSLAQKVSPDDWVQIKPQFTPNIPSNLLEEAQIAKEMEGVTSHETQLKVISAVDNINEELKKIKNENEAPMEQMTKALFGAVGAEGNEE